MDTEKDTTEHYCEVCNVWIRYNVIVKDNYKEDKDSCNYLIHCPDCHRIWDGNAQCPCGLIIE
jgi:hypothetical protein